MIARVCPNCGKSFVVRENEEKTVKYCSVTCRLDFNARKTKEMNKIKREKKKNVNKDLIKYAIEARKNDMSYGSYVGKLWWEKEKEKREKQNSEITKVK